MLLESIKRILHKIAFVAPGGWSIRPWLHKRRGVKIDKNVWISQYVYLDELHPEAISIGKNCSIGLRTSIFTHFYWGKKRQEDFGEVIIEDDVFIGPHCLILPNVKIGKGAVVKGGSVITRDVPPHVMVGYANPEILAKVTIPLTSKYSYLEFANGLRPFRLKKKANT